MQFCKVNYRKFNPAFSLVELLVALGILGVLAAFTIPGIFLPTKDYNGMARSTALMVNSAYEQYSASVTQIPANTTMGALTPYMQYINKDTSTVVDDGGATSTCGSGNVTCLRLANGAMFFYYANIAFGGKNTTNAIFYKFDPDGKSTGQSSGKSLVMFLQYNGMQYNWGNIPATLTVLNGGTFTATPSLDPTWFKGF